MPFVGCFRSRPRSGLKSGAGSDVASARIDLVVMNCGHGALTLAPGVFAADAYRLIVGGVFESCALTTERRGHVVVEGIFDKGYQLLPVEAKPPSKPELGAGCPSKIGGAAVRRTWDMPPVETSLVNR